MATVLCPLRRSSQLRPLLLRTAQSGMLAHSTLNHNILPLPSLHGFGRGLKRHSSSSSQSSQHPGRLEKLTCMVTGASSGIGFAIAQRMLLEGAEKVILVGRNSELLDSALQRLGQSIKQNPVNAEPKAESKIAAKEAESKPFATQSGGWGSFYSKIIAQAGPEASAKAGKSPVHADDSAKLSSTAQLVTASNRVSVLVGDVGDPSFWSEDVKKAMKKVDILVNSAGVSYSSLLPFAKDDAIAEMLSTNLQGTIFACRAMVSRVLRQPPPSNNDTTKCIINISSLHGTKGGIGAATYASTKAGVIALTRAIAAEGSTSRHGARIRANVIVPGYIETKMLSGLSPQVREEARLSVPLRRFGTCEEVADAAIFLATNQYANNCVLNLDGGLSAL